MYNYIYVYMNIYIHGTQYFARVDFSSVHVTYVQCSFFVNPNMFTLFSALLQSFS